MAALSPGPRRASRSGSGREPAHRDPQGGLCPHLCLGACFIPSPQERRELAGLRSAFVGADLSVLAPRWLLRQQLWG